jgi:hypothetical protein
MRMTPGAKVISITRTEKDDDEAIDNGQLTVDNSDEDAEAVNAESV